LIGLLVESLQLHGFQEEIQDLWQLQEGDFDGSDERKPDEKPLALLVYVSTTGEGKKQTEVQLYMHL
jgi:hypothetical protein